MAKQTVNIVERHVDKAVLGVCAAAFLATVALYLVSTPNRIELGSDTVGPDGIDQQVLDAAHKLRDAMTRAKAEEFTLEKPLPKLVEASSPLAYAKLDATIPAPVPMLPRVPGAVDPVPVAGEIELATVIAPIQPKVTHDRAMVAIPPPVQLSAERSASGVEPAAPVTTDVNWVTVAALFDQQEQINVNKAAGYKVKDRNPYVVGVDLQRRARQASGEYGEWTDVKAYLPARLPDPPKVEIVEARRGKAPTTTSFEAVRQFFALVRSVQAELARPLFPEVQYGRGWVYPKHTAMDVPSLDRELCTSDSGQGCPPRPYPDQWDVAPNEDTAQKSARELIEQTLGEAQAALNSCQWAEARTLAQKIVDDAAARRNQIDQAKQLVERADQGERDEKTRKISPCANKGKDGHEDLSARRSQHQVVWAHDVADAANGGAEPGKTYEYRMRVRLFNLFCAVPEPLKESEDATIVSVAGEWSEPTEELVIPMDTRFFLSSGSSRRNAAKVAVFKWYEGEWVTGEFEVEVGQPIRGSARVPVRVVDGGEVDKPLVDFDTGMACVDLDFEYPDRTVKTSSKGVTLGPASPTIAMVYMDKQGELHQRSLLVDRSSEVFKEFKEKVFVPKTAKP
ncbi:MAG: hypothetical protein HOP29_13415 [Phycisphaerales bacterium]|nr:hypothetical protein [Phycisphaerales bacterium]